MTVNELRKKLKELGVKMPRNATKKALEELYAEHVKTDVTETKQEEVKEQKEEQNADLLNEVENVILNTELIVKRVMDPRTLKMVYLYGKREFSERVEVYYQDGTYIRTYSRKDHGKNFRELAQKFIDTRTDRILGRKTKR